MKRTEFFTGILGAIAATAIPSQLKSNEIEHSEKEFSFDEVFEQQSKNELLYYPKADSEIYKQIKKLVGEERILTEWNFSYYLGYHYNLIQIKQKYTISDFMPFVLALNSQYQKNQLFAEWDRGVFFRVIRERGTDTMYFDTFASRSR